MEMLLPMSDLRSSRADDRALVDRCLAGDATAFDELVSLYGGMVFNLAYRQLGDREEALDLSQDVFLRVHRKLSSFRGDSALKTWIFRIVINLAHNRHKSWKSRRRDRTMSLESSLGAEDDGPTLGDRLPDERHDPERAAHTTDTKRLIEDGLLELSTDHREILVLRDIEELSYDEVAGILDVSIGTVKSRISRARARLKEVLDRKLSR